MKFQRPIRPCRSTLCEARRGNADVRPAGLLKMLRISRVGLLENDLNECGRQLEKRQFRDALLRAATSFATDEP